jgi:hypothetical protein
LAAGAEHDMSREEWLTTNSPFLTEIDRDSIADIDRTSG